MALESVKQDLSQSKRLWCGPDTFVVNVDADLVLLDAAGDVYHCLLSASDWIELRSDGELFITDPDLADDLLQAGLAVTTPLSRARRPPILPARELTLSSRPRMRTLLSVALGWAVAGARFRGRPLSFIIADRRRSRVDKKPDETELADLVGAARLVRPWIPFEGECLQRSFQLRQVLANRSIAADLVFGVRTWPFSAHCWLQIGDLVVGDRLARVRRYAPIMRV